MQVSSQINAPTALHPGREHEVPIVWEGVWTPVPVWALVRSEKVLPLLGIAPWIIQLIAWSLYCLSYSSLSYFCVGYNKFIST